MLEKEKKKTQTVRDASATSGFAISTGSLKADTIRNDRFSSIIITAAAARVSISRVHVHRPWSRNQIHDYQLLNDAVCLPSSTRSICLYINFSSQRFLFSTGFFFQREMSNKYEIGALNLDWKSSSCSCFLFRYF